MKEDYPGVRRQLPRHYHFGKPFQTGMQVKPIPGSSYSHLTKFLPLTELNVDVNIQDSIAVIKMQ